MAKTITLNRFDGGVVNNGRTPSPRHARAVANFNVLVDPWRLVPYVSAEDGDSSASSNQIQNFCLGNRGSNTTLFGLGIDGSNRPSVFYRDISDLADATWSTTANNQNGGTADPDRAKTFFYYPNQDKVYFWSTNASLEEYDPDAPSTNQSLDLASAGLGFTSFTTASNGLVHSKDDIAYIGVDNYILSKNGSGSWALGLTLPVGSQVNAIAEYGNYLAIATTQSTGIGPAQVYLWNRDGSLSTVSENISWGDEDLRILEEIEGELIGISVTADTAADTFEKIIFRRYRAGAGGVRFLEINSGHSPTVGTQLPRSIFQKYRGRLYFMMTATINSTVRTGVWSIGRNPRTQEWTLVHERTSNNDTALNSSHNLRSFFNIRDLMFQAHQDNGTYAMTKTNDQETYSATSYLETVVNPGMEASDYFAKKKLISVTCHYEALPTNGQVVVKYKTDEASSYTTVFTDSTDSSKFTEMVTDTNGTAFTDGREFEFRIESTGGAIITALSYKYELMETNY